MADSIADLSVGVSTDLASLYTGMRQAVDVVGRAGTQMAASMKGFQDAISAVDGQLAIFGTSFRGLIGVASIGAFGSMIKSTIDAEAELGRLAERAGTTVEALSSMRVAAKQGGLSLEEVTVGSTRLSKAVFEATDGTSKAAKALELLGLDAKKLNLETPEQQMLAVARSMAQFADSGQKTAVVMELLGKSGAQFQSFLKAYARDGGAAASITTEQANAARAAEAQFGRLAAQTTALQRSMVNELIPSLTSAAKAFADMNAVSKQPSGLGNFAGNWITAYALTIEIAVVAIKDFIVAIKGMAGVMAALEHGDMAGATKAIADQKEEWGKNATAFRKFMDTLAEGSPDITGMNNVLSGTSGTISIAAAHALDLAEQSMQASSGLRQMGAAAGDAKVDIDKLNALLDQLNAKKLGFTTQYAGQLKLLKDGLAAGIIDITKYNAALNELNSEQPRNRSQAGGANAYATALQGVREMAAEANAALAALIDGTGKLTTAQSALAKLEASDVWKTFNASQRETLATMYDAAAATQKDTAALQLLVNAAVKFEQSVEKTSLALGKQSAELQFEYEYLQRTGVAFKDSAVAAAEFDITQGDLSKWLAILIIQFPELSEMIRADRLAKAANVDTLKELIKSQEDFETAQKASISAYGQETDALRTRLKSLEDQNFELVNGSDALNERNIAELQYQLTLTEVVLSTEQATAADYARSVSLREQIGLLGQIGNQQKLNTQLNGWKELFTSIADRGSKFIEDFVQHGSSAFKNLWEDFKSWALQALAKIAAQQIIVSIVGAVGGTGSTIANAASSLTGGNSGASIISTLLQKGGSLFGNSALGSTPTTAAGLGTGSFDYGAGASGADLGGGGLPSSGISNLLSNTYGSIMSGAGSMLFGVGSAGAVAMGAGFSAGISTLGIAASAGTAAVGGMGAAMGALGAVAIPVVGWIIAAVALLKAAGVFDHGGPKIGGSATNIPDYGSFFPGEETDTGNKLAQAVVDGTQQSFQAALRSLGGKGTAGFAFGYDTDPEGTADARVSAGAVVNGQSVFTQRDVGAGKDATSAQAALQLEAERALLAALKASDLPTYLASLFDGLDAATASADAITKVIATAQAIRTVAEAIPDLAAQFEKMDAGQINALVDAFGGLAEFTKSAQFIAANFTTSAEKYGAAQADLVKGFDDLGLAVPKTHQAFLDLLGSFDPTTEAGKDMYAAVSQLAPLFVEVAGTADQAAAALANQIKSATDFFAENFFSDAEKQAVQLAADTALLAKAQQDLGIQIPTSIAGFRELVLGIDRSTAAGEALYEALIVLAPAVFDLGKAVETTAAQIVNATNVIVTSVGGIIHEAAGLANTLLGQFSTLADASPGDFGAKLGIQINLIYDAIQNADPSQFSSRLGFDTYISKLGGASDVLADQLARFTILSAQYDAARAEQLVGLQDWYAEQELIFSRTNNTAALDALRTIFDQKWDAIVSGSQAAVSSLDDFIKKIQELANATGGNAGQQAGIELALSSAQIDKLQGQLAGIDLTSALGQSIQSQIGKLQTYNAGLATQIAHFTIYTAQFGKATASQLVDLENWYTDQQSVFAGNTDALAILGDIFNDKWKAIIDGTNSGVNGTIDAMQRIADYLKGLFVGDLSPLTPLQKLQTAKQAYEAEFAKAQGGDVGALGDVTKFADVFLNLQRQFSASSQAYTDVFGQVTSDLGSLAGTLPNGQPIPTTPADVNAALVSVLPASGTLASSEDFKAMQAMLARLIEELANANTADSIAEREALQAAAREIAAAVSGPELP